MRHLYCPDCGEYLMVGDGECKDCHCGWKQPLVVEDDCYTCDHCGDIYLFSSADNVVTTMSGEKFYLIQGWYGGYDNQQLCDRCQDYC